MQSGPVPKINSIVDLNTSFPVSSMCSMDDTYLVVSAGESIYSIHSEATLYVNDIIIYIT